MSTEPDVSTGDAAKQKEIGWTSKGKQSQQTTLTVTNYTLTVGALRRSITAFVMQ